MSYSIKNSQLLFFLFFALLILSSCKKAEDIITTTEEEMVDVEEIDENQEEEEDDDDDDTVPSCPLGIYNGVVVSYQDSRADIDALGASVVHSWFQWDFVEVSLSAPFLTEEEVTEEMIEKYASGEREGIDWTFTDNHINEFEGLDLIMGVGSGWKNSVPLFNGEKITPDGIGRSQYLGQLYLHTRACVRRYKDKVVIWQIENEPNISEILIALGHREGDAWNDDDFMTEVLTVLERAVRAEDSDALVTINFAIDIADYQIDIDRWIDLIDLVGVDSYRDIFTSNPLTAADSVLYKIERIANLTEGKQVMILETGYSSGPENSVFSEEKQKVFIEEVYSRLGDFNGCGAMYFKHITSEQNGSGLFPNKHYRGLINVDNERKLAWHFLKDFFE